MKALRWLFGSLAAALLCGAAAGSAVAATIEFHGSRSTFGGGSVPNPARCGLPAPPNLFVQVPVGSGSSNLGTFAHDDSHCTNVATGDIFDGLFEWDFGNGDVLFGTFTGKLALPPVDGIAAFEEPFIVTGGTGRFWGATGGFLGIGFGIFTPNGVNTTMDFKGSLNVAEPATAATLALALLALAALRRRPLAFRV